MFKKIGNAYEVLSDSDKRQTYDLWLEAEGLKGGLRDNCAGGPRKKYPNPVKDETIEIEIFGKP